MHTTDNTRAFIESQQYSNFILLNLQDGLLPDSFYRNVTDFVHGEVLNIKTVGEVTLQEAEEDTPLVYNPIESGEITFRITEYKGDAWYITDDLREDGNQIDALLAERATASTRAIQESFESDFLKTAGDAFGTDGSGYPVNGFAHKVVAETTNNTFTTDHLVDMRLAFTKANVPAEGRIFIVDPVVEATLAKLVQITHDVTPFGQKILEQGLASGQQFLMKLFGWDIMTSNRLPVYTNPDDGVTTPTKDMVANLFMCILDDQTKPLMGAWRRMPKSEGDRNKDLARDEHVVRARYGFGVQRMDTLGVLYTDQTATA